MKSKKIDNWEKDIEEALRSARSGVFKKHIYLIPATVKMIRNYAYERGQRDVLRRLLCGILTISSTKTPEEAKKEIELNVYRFAKKNKIPIWY